MKSKENNSIMNYLPISGLIGATNECQALENAWKDPYNRHEIEEFVKAWLRKKRREREESIIGVV